MPSDSAGLLRQLIMGFRDTQMVYVAAKLGLADRLAEHPKSAGELAQEVDAHPGALYRVLRALASLGVMEQTSDDTFRLAPGGELLRNAAPGSMRNIALLYGDEWLWRAYGGMLHSVQTGEPAFPAVHGTDFYEFLRMQSEAGATFQAAMDAFSHAEAEAILRAYAFDHVHSVVDVGSGRGVLLSAILRMHAQIEGVAFDMPSVEGECRRAFAENGLTRRATFVAGNFFRELPEGRDLYLLKSVLHNWDDAAASRILQVCRRAMSPGSRLLIIERVIRDDHPSQEAKLFDINMLVTLGGQERTAEEYRALLAQNGFASVGLTATQSAMSIVEATPLTRGEP
ncbi:MAG TPA: methyltransferase [Bryobacteraceae bacterium]|nr:methyltransferase [Bryobacteraceae bacterium]